MAVSSSNSKTIMVVEDEPVVLDLVANILKGEGYKVLCAHSGHEALQIVGEHIGGIDLVLTDIVMPGMNGAEFVRRLLPVKPETHVLYMSAYTKYAVVNHGVLESVSSFIWKPFSPTELLRKVREVLDGPGQSG